jgi:hypothetical protein
MRERAETALEDPQGKLERALIEEYLQQRGCSLATVSMRAPGERQQLLADAAQHAAVRLAEIDARAAYLHQIHGGTERT